MRQKGTAFWLFYGTSLSWKIKTTINKGSLNFLVLLFLLAFEFSSRIPYLHFSSGLKVGER